MKPVIRALQGECSRMQRTGTLIRKLRQVQVSIDVRLDYFVARDNAGDVIKFDELTEIDNLVAANKAITEAIEALECNL